MSGPSAAGRYAALERIDGWRQDLLRQARVIVAGAGALGNEVLKNLALLGVGRVLIVDHDRVEVSNLTRSVLYRLGDAGRRKAEVAAERVREINPDVRVGFVHGDLTHGLGLGVYRRADLVFGCVDNRAARLALNRACWRTETPWVDGALDTFRGLARVFIPPASACYECTLTDEDFEVLAQRYSCVPGEAAAAEGSVPTTPTTASFIAALQVQEGVKLLHGRAVRPGVALYFNGEACTLSPIAYPRREDCYSHESDDEATPLGSGVDDLTVGDLLDRAARHAGAESVLLLDREVVRALGCPRCETREDVYRPYDDVVPAYLPCPRCGEARLPSVAVRLPATGNTRSVGLRQLGVPALHVVRVAAGGRVFFFELDRDEKVVLRDWEE